MIGLEVVFLDEQVLQCEGVISGVAELGPVCVIVDGDDRGPAFAIRRHGGRGGGCGRLCSACAGQSEGGAIPRNERVSIGFERFNDHGKSFEANFVNVVKEDDASSLFFDFSDNAPGDGIRHRISPVLGIDIPNDGLHLVTLHFFENFVVDGTVGWTEENGRAFRDVG